MTQQSAWEEIRARWAEASPSSDRDAVLAPAQAVDPSDPAFDPTAQAVDPSDPAFDPTAQAVDPSDPVVVQDAFLVPDPDGWTDPLTGTEGPRFWERIIAKEEARRRRYGRGATVALVELTGFEGNRDWYKRELATQFFARIGRALAREIRTSDHIARIAPARFGIVLLETDEIGAINFIDRVRVACRREFWAGSGLAIRTGWASASEVVGLGAAVVLAEKRLGDAAYQEAPELTPS